MKFKDLFFIKGIVMFTLTAVIKDNKRYDYGASGYLFLTSASNYGAGAGISLESEYKGFIVAEGGATITAINFGTLNSPKYVFAAGEDISDFTFSSGGVYFMDFRQITITAGALMLIRR